MPYVGLARHWTEPTYQWGGNQPQGGRRAQIPPTKIKMAYTPVPTRPNTPGIQQLPTGRFSAPFSRRAHGGMIMVIIEELWWGVGCPVRGGLGPWRGGRWGAGVVSGAARVTYDKNMTTSRGYRRHITGRSSAMGKRAFVASLESYHRTRVAGLVLFFALKLITIARRVVRRTYSPGGSGYAIARARFYHAASRTRAYTPTPH